MDEKLIYKIASSMIGATMLEMDNEEMREIMLDSIFRLTIELVQSKYKKPKIEIIENIKKESIKVRKMIENGMDEPNSTFKDFINKNLKDT